MNFIKKILHFFSKKMLVLGIIIIVLIVVGVFVFNKKKVVEETITVSHSDFVNKVSVSGQVVPTENVNLSFKNEGLIDKVYVTLGQTVKTDVIIAKLDTENAEKVVHDAETSLSSAKLSLDKLKLTNSNDNLSADLSKAYEDSFTILSDTFFDLSNVVTGLNDVLSQDNISSNSARTSGQTALDYRNNSEKLYYDAKDSFEKTRKDFRLLDRNSSKNDIENTIDEAYNTTKLFSDAIKSTKNLVDYLAEDTGLFSDFASAKTALSTYGGLVDGHLSDILSIQKSIKAYKDAFSTTGIDMQDLLLAIKDKENALQDAKNALNDYYIKAPFDGVITKIDAKVGEIATKNTSLISMMSAGVFQIESYVPEINIAQVKLDDEASVTLDAYGDAVTFIAKVISIDPAETVRDGVSTYRIKLQFSTNDDRIKSGMTANVSITTFSKPNVIVVPGGVIFEKGGKKFVQIKSGEQVSNREVVTGGVSYLGKTEIVSGLSDGDVVLLNPAVK